MKFNEKLKKIRLSKNMTQEELAEKLIISRQSISKWEQGINEPSIETIKEICKIFDISVSELISDEKKESETKDEKLLKREHALYLVISALTIFGLLLTFVMIRLMNDTIPMHYDIRGNITRYGSKWETLYFLGLYLITYSFSLFIHLFYLKKNRDQVKSMVVVQITLLIIQLSIMIGNLWMGFGNGEDLSNNYIPTLIGIIMALYFTLSIFLLPKFNKQRNSIFGFRTSFTLSNQDVWKKVNFVQGISGITFSIIAYLVTLITFETWNIYILLIVIVSFIPAFIYHEILRKSN